VDVALVEDRVGREANDTVRTEFAESTTTRRMRSDRAGLDDQIVNRVNDWVQPTTERPAEA